MSVHVTQERSWQARPYSVLFQILGWNPKTGTPTPLIRLPSKQLPLGVLPCPSACCCLHSSPWHPVRSGWDLWLVYVSICLSSHCLQTWLWASRTDFHRNQNSLPSLSSPHLLLLNPHPHQAPGAYPTDFTLEFHTSSWTACVACASSKSELFALRSAKL